MEVVAKKSAIVFVIVSAISGCATNVDAPNMLVVTGNISQAQMIPIGVPMPVRTIDVYDTAQKKRVEVDVLSLKPKDIRERLTSTETLVSIEKRDTSGSLSYLGAGGRVSKGSYRVTFDYANYTNQNITYSGDDRSTAIGRIGVGLRITADLETFENGVDLGGLLPIGFAAQNKKVNGRLSFLVYGMSNDKVALAVPSNSPILDVTSIQQSFESAATVRVLFGLDDTKLEPYLIGVADIKPSDAKKALEAATMKLTK